MNESHEFPLFEQLKYPFCGDLMVFLTADCFHPAACLLSPQECLPLFFFASAWTDRDTDPNTRTPSSLSLSSRPSSTLPLPPVPVPQQQLHPPSPRSAHLCARLQPLVHLVDPVLGLDHVGRVPPVEGSERRRVERVVGRVGHGGSWRGARRDLNIQRAQRQRTSERDALQRPPAGSSRGRV